MPLNPLAFRTKKEFEQALVKQGIARGWTPIDNTTKVIAHILKHMGHYIIERG